MGKNGNIMTTLLTFSLTTQTFFHFRIFFISILTFPSTNNNWLSSSVKCQAEGKKNLHQKIQMISLLVRP